MNGPRRTACLAKGYNNDKYKRSIGYGQKPMENTTVVYQSCQRHSWLSPFILMWDVGQLGFTKALPDNENPWALTPLPCHALPVSIPTQRCQRTWGDVISDGQTDRKQYMWAHHTSCIAPTDSWAQKWKVKEQRQRMAIYMRDIQLPPCIKSLPSHYMYPCFGMTWPQPELESKPVKDRFRLRD